MQVIVLNVMPASAVPPARVTGTCTDCPGATGDVGGDTGVTAGVKVIVIKTDAGVTLPESVDEVSWTDPVIEKVGLLAAV